MISPFRQTKKDADEESRSRQYDGTARENDKVSKAPVILVFGIPAKNNIYKSLPPKLTSFLMIGFVYYLRFAMRSFSAVCFI